MGIETFEIDQPGRRTIRVTPNDAGNHIEVEVIRQTETVQTCRRLGWAVWQREIGPDGSWCGYVEAAAFMPDGTEPRSVVVASVPVDLYNADPATGKARMVVTSRWGDPMASARGVASWCINGKAPALGYIPHTWPIRGRGIRGAMTTLANRVQRITR